MHHVEEISCARSQGMTVATTVIVLGIIAVLSHQLDPDI